MNNFKSLFNFGLYCLLLVLLHGPGLVRADNPRDINDQKNTGESIEAMEEALLDMMLNKEILDIGYAAYLQGRPGEEVPPDPYVGFLSKRQKLFCSPTSGVELAAFQGDGCEEDKSLATEYGDIKLSGLLAPDGYDEAQQVIAEEVIRNLTGPFPSQDIKQLIADPEALKQQGGKIKFGMFFANQAALTAARYVLNKMFEFRLSGELIDSGDRASIMQSIKTEIMDSRRESSQWHNRVAGASDSELFKELVLMGSISLMMDYYKLKSAHRQEVLLAVMLANSINANAQQTQAISSASEDSDNPFTE